MKATIINILKWLEFPEKPYPPSRIGSHVANGHRTFRNRGYHTVLFALSFLLISTHATAQMIVGENTIIAGTGDVELSLDSSLINNGQFQLTDNFTVHLNGEGTIDGSQGVIIPRIQIDGYGYVLNTDVVVTDSLYLVAGTIYNSASNLFLVQETAGIRRSGDSHIEGFLTHRGSGDKFFPIGINDTYAPIRITHESSDSDLEISLAAYDEAFTTSALPENIADVSPNYYWEMEVDGDYDGSIVTLPILDQDAEWIQEDQYPVIVEADEFGMGLTNIGGSFEEGDTQIVSSETTQGKRLMLGVINEVEPIIHNIITPGDDDDNPYLIIENIEAFRDNEVSLVDRWGNEVYHEADFANYNNSDNPYNGEFDDLPSGNYVCILRYNNQTETRMVSLIRQ